VSTDPTTWRRYIIHKTVDSDSFVRSFDVMIRVNKVRKAEDRYEKHLTNRLTPLRLQYTTAGVADDDHDSSSA
jgi:hypothetical protein